MTKESGGTREVATFWHGPALSRLEIACLMSFVARGFQVTMYSYAPLEGLPDEVQTADAAQIVDPAYLFAFRVLGKPSLSHFSDLFRYRLFELTGKAWIDSDLFCLNEFTIPLKGHFFSKETATGINGAIMRIDPADPRLKDIASRCTEFANGKEFEWGSTGPALVTKVFGTDALDSAQLIERFYPIHWTQWWRPFVPSEREWCEETCRSTDALHLWNNIVERSGYWKDLAPPVGSYLHDRLSRDDLTSLFKETCPESVMLRLMESDINLRTGRHLQFKEMLGMATIRATNLVRRRLRV